VAYRLKSKVLSAISTLLKPIDKVVETGKALVGATRYNFKYLGALVSANSPQYDFRKLRQIYRRFGFIRQALSAYKTRATSELPDIVCDNISARKRLMERLKEMGIFEQLPDMFQDLPLFGNVFYEIVYDEEEIGTDPNKLLTGKTNNTNNTANRTKVNFIKGIEIAKNQDIKEKARRLKKILGIKRLEPDYMQIVVDDYGRVLYYVSIRDGAKPVVLERWRIIHIKLDPLPGDCFGIGLVEGAIDDISALRMVEDLQLQLIKHDIYPFRMFSCPSNEVVLEVEAKLSEQERFGDLVVPDGVEMKQSTVGNASQDLRALMKFYEEKIFMDLGVPMGMLIQGNGTNKSTAVVQSDSFNHNVYSMMNQIYLPMEKFCRLVLLFEGINSDVTWNYKDIDRAGETVVRKEIVQWFKEGIIDGEDAVSLLDTYGGFRYLPERQKARIHKKSKPNTETQGAIEGEQQPVGLPGPSGDATQEPEFGDRIADDTNIEKPTRITDRIRERITKPDGTRVEKTTERIKQSIDFATNLRDEIIKCDNNLNEIGEAITNIIASNGLVINQIPKEIENFCGEIDDCIGLFNDDKDNKQYEFLISKVCSDFSRKIIGELGLNIKKN
jgi:hypothetical protein